MFFKDYHFRKVLDDKTARVVAAIANQTINDHGKVFYGNLFKDGSAGNFSTVKEDKDTHVCIGIGIDEMGLFADDKTIATTVADEEEIAEVVQQRNEILQRENNKLRQDLNKKEQTP